MREGYSMFYLCDVEGKKDNIIEYRFRIKIFFFGISYREVFEKNKDK